MCDGYLTDGPDSDNPLYVTVPAWSRAIRAWGQIDAGWPTECRAEWLSAEAGRVTSEQSVVIVWFGVRPAAAATIMHLDGTEERSGYDTIATLFGTLDDSRSTFHSPELEAPSGVVRQSAWAELLPCVAVAATGAVQPGIIWDQTLSRRARDAALDVLVEHLGRSPRANSAVVHAIPRTDRWRPLRDALARHHFIGCAGRPVAELAIPGGGVDEWIEQFTKQRRKNFRREMRHFHDWVDSVSLHDPGRMLEDDLVHLQMAKYEKYGHETSASATRDRLRRGAQLPGMVVQVASQNEKAVAFTAFIQDNQSRRFASRFSGTAPNNSYAYFNMCYYERINLGATEGCSTLSLGPEAYRAKLSRGAELVAVDSFVYHTDARLRKKIQTAADLRTQLVVNEVKAASRGLRILKTSSGWSVDRPPS